MFHTLFCLSFSNVQINHSKCAVQTDDGIKPKQQSFVTEERACTIPHPTLHFPYSTHSKWCNVVVNFILWPIMLNIGFKDCNCIHHFFCYLFSEDCFAPLLRFCNSQSIGSVSFAIVLILVNLMAKQSTNPQFTARRSTKS